MFGQSTVITKPIFKSSDPYLSHLSRRAEERQKSALRPGTKANHRSVLFKFIKFLGRCRGHFTSPSPQQICLFFEHCLKTAKNPATGKNYASGLASVYRQMGLSDHPFRAFYVKNALVSMDRNIRHTPTPSLPVTPAILKRVVRVTNGLKDGPTLTAAYVLLFHTFYRQSNFSASTAIAFDHTRQLTRQDVDIKRDSVVILHKWSKTHQSSNHAALTVIPAIPGSQLCPRRAMLSMLRHCPTRRGSDPLLMFQDRSHMPVSYLRKVWKAVLKSIDIPQPMAYTLHGLRRGAATHIINSDPSAREDIRRHGLWRSDAVDTYLPPTSSKVFKVMRDTL